MMAMMTRYKRILGLFAVAFAVLFANILNVSAAIDVCGQPKPDNHFVSKYDIDVKVTKKGGEWVYEISCGATKKSSGVDPKKIKFELNSVFTFDTPVDSAVDVQTARTARDSGKVNIVEGEELKKYASSVYLTPGSTITFKRGGAVNDSKNGIHFTLYPVGFMDPELDKCAAEYAKSKKIELEEVTSVFFIEYAVAASTSGSSLTTVRDASQISSSCTKDSTSLVNCDDYKNKYKKESFDYKFCEAKENAKDSKNSYTFNISSEADIPNAFEKKWGADKPHKFECDYKTLVDSQTKEVLDNDEEYYKYNRKYLYGEASYKHSAGTYVYNYEYGRETEEASCTVTCQESVVTEYGPPIASKAGICFEYKVKVTSRVSCGISDIKNPNGGNKTGTSTTTITCEDIQKPRTSKICTPRPYCVHPGGGTYLQGGPNEEFDECINSCDKGKYTDKCVTKCYKKVYGNKNKIAKSTNSSDLALYETVKVEDAITSELDSLSGKEKITEKDAPGSICNDSSVSRKYCYDSNNEIVWITGVGTDRSAVKSNPIDAVTGQACNGNPCRLETDSTWHRNPNNKWGTTAWNGYVLYTTNGIPKAEDCTDSCSWLDCTKGSQGDEDFYLNEEQAKQDDTYNDKVYQQLTTECNAAVSCTTATAEFTISVDVKTGENKKLTFNYPYDEKNENIEKAKERGYTTKYWDKLTTNGNVETKPPAPNTASSVNTTILNYAGCYLHRDAKKFYQAEWTFPGMWIDNKTGAVTYKPQPGSTHRAEENKFCLPKYAKLVNAEWARAYYSKFAKETDKQVAQKHDEYLRKIQCEGDATGTVSGSSSSSLSTKVSSVKSDITKYTIDNVDYKKIDWNIHASTKKFGFFGWYIDIKCFYSNFKEITTPGGEKSSKKDEKLVDEVNITCDDKHPYVVRSIDLKNVFPDKSGEKLTDLTTTGRSPGFNWSEHATMEKAGETYTSHPKEYITWVQETGYGVYSDRYLDYYIKLTKDDIAAIKKKKINYAEYEDGKTVINETINYKSNLIRSEIKDAKYPNDTALRCNNMQNYTSGACEKVGE